MLAFAAFLLISLPWQTKWINGVSLFSQPRFWPALAIGGLLVFTALYCVYSLSKRTEIGSLAAQLGVCKQWLAPLEYMLYFVAYVFFVPRLGYLLATLAFCGFLVWRSGYRSRKVFYAALALGFAVVVIFKTFLQVKIPGGMVYQYLPNAMRNFMIVNF